MATLATRATTTVLAVAGDARLDATLDALDALRTIAEAHSGSVIDDGRVPLLVAFGSTYGAVTCAVALQQDTAGAVRTGVAVGEATVEGDRLSGPPLD
nr:hypothetical protein [Actinomycetota bacterium]